MAEHQNIQRSSPVHPGAPDDFQRLTEPYQRELLVHCYRFFGSLEDAEDALQEALLRAWRGWDSLHSPAALRAWLYKISTRVCLDMLKNRRRRSMPSSVYPPANPLDPLPAPIFHPVWLEPLPEEYLDGASTSPEARYELHESVSLAFLTVLQQLPGRQRAALILQDVLGWKAQEAAELLDLSVVAVNSALQRARAAVRQRRPASGFYSRADTDSPQTSALLTRYVQAWEAADLPNLVSLLREDVILSMPPLPAWYQGRAAVQAFFSALLFSPPVPGRFMLSASRANGCPAFAIYQRGEDGSYHLAGLQVIRIEQGQITEIDDFLALDERLFRQFKIPMSINR